MDKLIDRIYQTADSKFLMRIDIVKPRETLSFNRIRKSID